MDSSSNSQPHSDHPSSSSSPDPGSGSGFTASASGSEFIGSGSGSGSGFIGSGSGSNSGIRSGTSGGSTGETTPSEENSTPEEDDNSSSSMKSQSSTGYEHEDEEDMDIDITEFLAPTLPEPESSTGKGKMIETETGSSGSREGKAEEIGLLTDLYTLYNRTGRYLMSGVNDQRDFYKFWIQEEGDYANEKELDEKILELNARFLKNMEKDVEGPTDPIDVEILRLSHWIWGDQIDDSCKETGDNADAAAAAADGDGAGDGDDQEQDPKDSSDVNMVNDGDDGVNPNDQTADHAVDRMNLKDSTKESGPIGKDSSSKAN